MIPARSRISWIGWSRLDAVLALALILEQELELFVAHGRSGPPTVLTAASAVLFTAPVSLRRRLPAATLLLSSAVALAEALLGGDLSRANGILLTPVLLAYGAGAWLGLRKGAAVLGTALPLLLGFVLTSHGGPRSPGAIATAVAFAALLLGGPWFVGRLARERSRRVGAFRELEARAAVEHEGRERAAVAEERSRIGRELQDIIAHSVSAMVIQAGAARLLLRTDPTRARAAILTVEQEGRETLADLRRLLGMLRRDDDPRALAPQPGLSQLGALVEAMHAGGLTCDLVTEGVLAPLTPGIDLVGYRVVEAALDRAAAGSSRSATVTVRHRRDRLELEIRADGPMPDLDGELGGILERVALYDGNLRALPGAAGFALQARLPLGAGGIT